MVTNIELRDKVRNQLQRGEQIVWVGQPTMRLFHLLDLLVIPFMLVWASAAIGAFISSLWQSLNGQGGFHSFMLLWCLPFACIGFYMLIGRFLHEYYLRKNRYFVVTNKRIAIFSYSWPSSQLSLALESVGACNALRSKQGGVLLFEALKPVALKQLMNPLAPTGYSTSNLAIFYDLRDIDSALSAIRTARGSDGFTVNELPGQLGLVFGPVDAQAVYKTYQEVQKLENAPQSASSNSFQSSKEATSEAQPALAKSVKSSIKKRPDSKTTEKGGIEQLSSEETQRDHRRHYVARSIGMLAGVICALSFGMTTEQRYRQDRQYSIASKSWPEAMGKISNVQIATSKNGSQYTRTIDVAYQVAGRNYSCDRFSFCTYQGQDQEYQLSFAKDHKEGDPVPVYYDPKDPSISVLDRSGAPNETAAYIARGFETVGLLLLSAILIRLWLAPRKRFPNTRVNQSLSFTAFRAGFFSVWCTMFFGGIISIFIGGIIAALSHG